MTAATANLFSIRPPFRAEIEPGENVRSNLPPGSRYLNAQAILSAERGGHQTNACCERAYRHDNEPQQLDEVGQAAQTTVLPSQK